MSNLLTITLSLVSALESNSGTNVKHLTVRSPSSIHYGEAAIGDYGMMPKTLQELKTADAKEGARRLATRILKRNTTNVRGYLAPSSPCPFITAVVLWERGPRARLTADMWRKEGVTRRLRRARMEWNVVQRSKSWTGRTFE